MRKALVTGGAGFIGSHLVAQLLADHWQVRVLDDFSTGARANLTGLNAEIMEGDIRDLSACRQACQGIEAVFHLAALSSVAASIDDPARAHEVNLTGTLNMLLAARDQKARRFIFSSSASVYGSTDVLPAHERLPLSPQSPYATGKATGEFYCRNFWELYELETVILRYFNVFGPRQNARSGYAAVIPRFVEAAVQGTAATVYGDGMQTRDFVFVENVARANVRAALAPQVAGQVFNIAGGQDVSLIGLLQTLEEITRRPIPIAFQPARLGEVRYSRADIAAAREALGYTEAVSVAAGLRATVQAAQSDFPLPRA